MKRKIKNFMAVMIAFAIVLSMSMMPATALISRAAVEGVNVDMAWEVLDIVNNERAAQGLNPITMDKGLMDAAQVRAYEIVSQFSHTRPDGTSCFTVLSSDYKYGSSGENIAAGQISAADVMNSWMNSEGHRANILNKDFQSIGIACVYVPDSVYRYHWVQLFHSKVVDPATRESQPHSEYLTYDNVGIVSVEDNSAIVVAEVSTNGDVIKYVAGHGISSDSISFTGIYETSLHRLTWQFDNLQPSTTYYYQYDVFTASGKDYKSNIYTFTTAAAPDTQGPMISDVIINNVSSDGFDVSCRATDNVAMGRVSFAVWSDNEANAQWITGTRSGDTYSCRALTSDHNNYTGHYNIHIYAYDIAGNESMIATAGIDVPSRVVEPVDMTVSPPVEKHSVDEIRQFVNDHPVTFASPEYTEDPSVVQPYRPGKLTSSTLQDALNMVNQIRYIAGMSYDVVLDEEFNEEAQAASLVNAVNGFLSNYPEQPSDMDDDLYRKGETGAMFSNLTFGPSTLASSIVHGYMVYRGNGMMDRRWVLHPYLNKTGFGIVHSQTNNYDYSAMHTIAGRAIYPDGRSWVSMWPAQNMPVEYFESTYPWSYTTGIAEDIEKIKVTLINTKTGKTHVFSKANSDGYFDVDNHCDTTLGTIIFIPDGEAYNIGDEYHVMIEGLSDGTKVGYDVNFFSLDKDAKEVIHPASVTLDRNSAELKVGESLQLNATVEPFDADDRSVKWTTRDSSIAVVSNTGEVTAVGEGTTVITVCTNDGGLSSSCTVTVTPKEKEVIHPASVTLDRSWAELKVGESLQLNATVEPFDADDRSVEWSTRDSSIAVVSNTGEVTAVGEGTTVISVWTNDGGFSSSCTVTVTPDKDEPEVVDVKMMFRLYNPHSGEHFYTADTAERNNLVSIGWKSEGSAWSAPAKSGTPVYRLYNPNAGDHHYTTDVGERDHLVKVGWKSEGIGWYSDDKHGKPLYRLYNPNALAAGAHHYTADVTERDHLISLGWRGEGIGWYGM